MSLIQRKAARTQRRRERIFAPLRACALALLISGLALSVSVMAQKRPAKPVRKTTAVTTGEQASKKKAEELLKEPLSVNTRIYQLRAAPNAYPELNDQVFRLHTAGLTDEEKWIRGFGKALPGFEFALLNSSDQKVFRSSRPTRVVIGKSSGRTLEVLQYGAVSMGDGKTPGTSLVVEVNLNFGRPESLSYAVQNLEVEDGMTYFFTVPRLKFNADDYVKFLRPGVPVAAFEGKDCYLVFAFSVELNPAAETTRRFDEKQSVELQAAASRKVQPDVPPALTNAGLGGSVRAQVEISPEGHVTHALVVNSSFPEMNEAVLAAARQWEFPATHFAQDRRPISAVLVFDFPVPAVKTEPKPPA